MTDIRDPAVRGWFERRTITSDGPSVADLVSIKRSSGRTVAVCLPALDEAPTVGRICTLISEELVSVGLVDELVVMDSGSSDRTREIAQDAGATVFRASEVLPEAGPVGNPGKGESLWKSLAVIDSDLVVWMDSDTRNFETHFVTRLIAPLLQDPSVSFVKAFYERPLETGTAFTERGGGRVTEIAVRPLINLLAPRLAGFIQPLSGEYASRTTLLRRLPFATGYDVDLLLLLDVIDTDSLDAVTQVDLGRRVHRNRDTDSLGRMSFQIIRGLLTRLERTGAIKLADDLPRAILQFVRQQGGYLSETASVGNEERPAMETFLS